MISRRPSVAFSWRSSRLLRTSGPSEAKSSGLWHTRDRSSHCSSIRDEPCPSLWSGERKTVGGATPFGLVGRRWRSTAALDRENGPVAGLEPMEPPLKGVRVVDLTRVLAGPYATMLLADLGADVIKIEHATRGDDTRAWIPPSAPTVETEPPEAAKGTTQDWSHLPPESAYFLSVNRGKRSIGVNLKTEEGKEIVRELIKKADVLVENYVPGKLHEMGLGYEDCREINPGLVYASITGYGQTGPYAKAPGYDVMIEAEAGLMHITGEPQGEPVKVGVAITDLTTGLYIHGAVMAALLSKQKTGKGTWIDASLFECQIASLANIGSNWLIAGQEAKRQGTAHPSIVPYQTYPTKDGWIMIGAGNDRQFEILSGVLENPEWPRNSKFASNKDRVANRDELSKLIVDALSVRTTGEWLEALRGKGIPFAPINNIQKTFEHPQALARQVVTEVEHPRAGKIKLLSPAVRYGSEKMPVTRPPPVLGQHTMEILHKELGYDQERIEALKANGTI